MAVGDAAVAAGYTIVNETGGDEARVRWGAKEINRTRDFLAGLKAMIPVGRTAYRTAAGISSGTANPTGGVDGDIYFKIVS
jgi:hypothetical protein